MSVMAMIRFFFLLVLTLLLPVPPSMAGTGPLATIQNRIDAAIAILKDPVYKNPNPDLAEEQHQKLFEHVQSIFDFQTISMLATGRNWQRFSDAQKKDFADLFAKLLANTYIEKVQDNFQNERVVYDAETLIGQDRSEVRTRVILSEGEIPVLYKLRNLRNTWRIYDINIEGISLIQNYRSQFEEFLFRREPAELILHMDKKIRELETQRIQRRKEGKSTEDPEKGKAFRIL